MSLRHNPTIDELLGDSLVQAVMRADKVEPQPLRTLLADTAIRVATARIEQRPANGLLAKLPARVCHPPFADPCGSALCS
jgi:hypothetical protein